MFHDSSVTIVYGQLEENAQFCVWRNNSRADQHQNPVYMRSTMEGEIKFEAALNYKERISNCIRF